MRLRLALLFAKDLDGLTAFYRDGLGLRVVPEESSAGWVVFDAGGSRFALHALPEAIAREIEIGAPPEARSESALKLVFATTDLEGACSRLAAGGATLLPARWPGSRDALDPEGNVFQVTEE